MSNALLGIDVHVVPGAPRYVLPDSLPLPDAFRAEFNEWARGFFQQRVHLIPDGQVWKTASGALLMNPNTFAALRAHIGTP